MPRNTQKIKVSHHYSSLRRAESEVESLKQPELLNVTFCNDVLAWSSVQTQTGSLESYR